MNIVVYGVGLIGGSAALAYRRSNQQACITGVGRSKANMEFAVNEGIVDRLANAVDLQEADIVLIATPPETALAMLPAIAEKSPNAVLTDALSTKTAICACATQNNLRHRLVPAHPIAGTENKGATAAIPDLFAKATTILTPFDESPEHNVACIQDFWLQTGSKVERMTAAEHDQTYSYVSHMPHLLMYALADFLLQHYRPEELALRSGGGLRGLLRIASSNPEMWKDIWLENQENILQQGSEFVDRLQAWMNQIKDEPDQLIRHLERTAEAVKQYQQSSQRSQNNG